MIKAEIHNIEYVKNIVKTKRKNIMVGLVEWIDVNIVKRAHGGHEDIRITAESILEKFDVLPSEEMMVDVAEYFKNIGGFKVEVINIRYKYEMGINISWE